MSDDRAEIAGLLAGRLALVTGKGGTGKTTFASALAMLAAAEGRRVLLAEVDAKHPSLPVIFGAGGSWEPVSVRPNLDVANLTWQEALGAFLERVVPSRRLVGAVLSNAALARFLDFTPGSRELVTLSAVEQHTSRYDLVVVDMPASGHALSLLDVTRSALGLFRSGPIRQRAAQLRDRILHIDTHVVLVALPEEMVVSETIETAERLGAIGLLSRPPQIFLNRATPPTMTEDEGTLLARLAEAPLSDAGREFVRAGRWEAAMEAASAAAMAGIEAGCGRVPIPVHAMAPDASPTQVVQEVAVALGRRVGRARSEVEWTT